MHLLTAASLKNRALIALVTIVAAVFGLIGMGSLKQELMPSVQFPAIVVVTSYPGASPEVVNNDVSGPIETALRGVPQLESTTATSSTGASMVLAQFTYGVDIAATEQKVERAVSRISQMLPETADTQVMSGSIDDFPVIQVAVTPAEGVDPEETARLLERVAISKLSDVDGVREAQLAGARGDRVTITPDPALLATYGFTAQSITDTLQQSGVLMAAGTVTDGEGTLAVQTGTALHSAEDIAALPLPRTPEQIATQAAELAQQTLQAEQFPNQNEFDLGLDAEAEPAAPVVQPTIGDVATVALEANPIDGYSRINGAPALTIAITKVSAANTVDVSHAVQEMLAEIEPSLDGASLKVIFDQAPYVEQSIHTLTVEGLLGLLFAVLVILVFLMSVRATLVTAISIPTSILLTFVGLNFADYTLNMLTLGALTISIGRVVDDSIVVIENIKRMLREGDDRAATIIRAVREVAGAITASTITTVAVFLPLAFVEGMVGELFKPFAFTVTIALMASLLVSLTIVPVLAFWFLKPDHEHRAAPVSGLAPQRHPLLSFSITEVLQRAYRPVISWTLQRPLATLMIAVVVFAGTIAASPLMKTNFMSSDEQNSIGLTQALTPGTSLEAQLAQAERVEEALAEVPTVETVQLTIAGSGTGMGAIFGAGGDGVITYSLTTDADADQSKVQDQVRKAVESLDEAGEFSLGMSDGGMTMSSAIEVYVTAPDQDTLAEASDAVAAALKEQSGLNQVESDLAVSRPYMRVAVDRAAAAAAGLSEAAVAGMVAQKMQPAPIGQLTVEANTVNVYLAADVPPADQVELAGMLIPTAMGELRLDSLASVEVADGPVTVKTEDTVRMVTVSALPKGDDLSAAGAEVTAALESVDLPAGAAAKIGGVMAQQEEAFSQLGLALLIAILIVYVVMVATFRSLLQPLLLLISVPFAATGAILLLIITGIPLGVASLIGVLMLIGIVVTNAIVLIDLVNQFRERGEALRDAVVHGAHQRLRPIVMTALATILALTPMALGITGKGGFISQPLAIVVIGGLLSSTVLTLIVLPTLYYIVERRREGGGGPHGLLRRGGDKPVGPRRGRRGDAALVAAAAGASVSASAGAVTAAAGSAPASNTGAAGADLAATETVAAAASGVPSFGAAQAAAGLGDAPAFDGSDTSPIPVIAATPPPVPSVNPELLARTETAIEAEPATEAEPLPEGETLLGAPAQQAAGDIDEQNGEETEPLTGELGVILGELGLEVQQPRKAARRAALDDSEASISEAAAEPESVESDASHLGAVNDATLVDAVRAGDDARGTMGADDASSAVDAESADGVEDVDDATSVIPTIAPWHIESLLAESNNDPASRAAADADESSHADFQQGVGQPDTSAADTAPLVKPSEFHAAPVTGELHWEQLMQQAVSDVNDPPMEENLDGPGREGSGIDALNQASRETPAAPGSSDGLGENLPFGEPAAQPAEPDHESVSTPEQNDPLWEALLADRDEDER